MKKVNAGLKRKVLCSILAAAAISVSGGAWAADNVIGTVKVDDQATDVTQTAGTFTLGEDEKTLSIAGGDSDAIALYKKGDNLTLQGTVITITIMVPEI